MPSKRNSWECFYELFPYKIDECLWIMLIFHEAVFYIFINFDSIVSMFWWICLLIMDVFSKCKFLCLKHFHKMIFWFNNSYRRTFSCDMFGKHALFLFFKHSIYEIKKTLKCRQPLNLWPLRKWKNLDFIHARAQSNCK